MGHAARGGAVVTLDQLLRERPDLKPLAAPMRAIRELHGVDWERAFNPSSEVWAAEIHAGVSTTTNRMDEAA